MPEYLNSDDDPALLTNSQAEFAALLEEEELREERRWASGLYGPHVCDYCELTVEVRQGDGQIRLISNDEFEVKCHACQQALAAAAAEQRAEDLATGPRGLGL